MTAAWNWRARRMEINNDKLIKEISALLFAVADPISKDKLVELTGASEEDVLKAVVSLKSLLTQYTGLMVITLEDKYQMVTRDEYYDLIKKALEQKKNTPLSQAALETLAVIAYNQPVSRAFIEQVRGVDSSSSVSSLLGKGLIEEAGRLNLPGKPISFKTSDSFLRAFGLESLADLPSVESMQQEINPDSLENIEIIPEDYDQ